MRGRAGCANIRSHMDSKDCPFCRKNDLLKGEIVAETDDAYMCENVTCHGTYLIIPNAHIESPAELPDDWWTAVKDLLSHTPGSPTEYNMSLNMGASAGQTVRHLHFWVIPRQARQRSAGKGLMALISEYDRD